MASTEYDPSKAPGVPIGEWNVLEASIGQRGMGKSTFQCYRALALAREAGGAYVIGHSLGARLPSRLPKELGGDALPICYHRTLADLDKQLRKHPERWHIIAPPMLTRRDEERAAATCDELLGYSIELSNALRTRAFRRAHPLQSVKRAQDLTGIPCPPSIVIVDEGVAIDAARTRKRDDDKWFLEYLYSLRHLHIALLYAIQNATARSWQTLEQATAIHCFFIRHEWALQSIRAAGASDEDIAAIRELAPHEHITIGDEYGGDDD